MHDRYRCKSPKAAKDKAEEVKDKAKSKLDKLKR